MRARFVSIFFLISLFQVLFFITKRVFFIQARASVFVSSLFSKKYHLLIPSTIPFFSISTTS